MANIQILLVEDTSSLVTLYKESLLSQGYDVKVARTGKEALLHLRNPFDLVLLDIKLPDISGLEIIASMHKRKNMCPVIVITGNGSLNIAIEAMRLGAQDFLVKPFQPEKLQKSIAHILLHAANDSHIREKPQNQKNHRFIGTSHTMDLVFKTINNAAKSNATVFITGESGTGKEVCAESIHYESARADKAFIAINCAAIPRDLIESELFGHVKGAFTGAIAERQGAVSQADGGTLFLDEIGEMPLDMQTKLLRFLQNSTFTKVGGTQQDITDARIICATNRDPLQDVQHGCFREDLYYRLHVLPIHMPPLRARGDDVIKIATHILLQCSKEESKNFKGFSPNVLVFLKTHPWPGNIRQLQNVIRHCVVMYDGENLEEHMLPSQRQEKSKPSPNFQNAPIPSLKDIEKEAILHALKNCHGNVYKAAALLDISPSTLYRKKAEW